MKDIFIYLAIIGLFLNIMQLHKQLNDLQEAFEIYNVVKTEYTK